MIDVHGTADNTRVAEPWKKTAGMSPEGWKYPDMTFHHLIPYNTLYPFWNIMLELSDPLVMGGDDAAAAGRQCFLKFMELLGVGAPVDMLATLLKARLPTAAVLLDATTRDDLAQKVLWTGWNIVEGPLNTIREDDPGESYDDFHPSLQKADLTSQALLATKNHQLNGRMTETLVLRKELLDLQSSIKTRQDSPTPLSKSAGKKLAADLRNLSPKQLQFATSLTSLNRTLDDLKDGSGPLKADWQTPLTYFDQHMWFKQTEPAKAAKPWITIQTRANRLR